MVRVSVGLALIALLCLTKCTSDRTSINVAGLEQPVDVFRDSAGVNHIYAQTEHDLFFAQGYCAARDRLFQFEVWRRQATGTMADLLGPAEVKRDIGARLFSFRGDIDAELNHYHPRGKQIVSAFTEGINARIREVNADTSLLPLEFKLLGFKPGLWTTRDVISRHQGILANLLDELRFARAIVTLGEEKVKELVPFEPGEPDLRIDPSIDRTGLFDSIASIYSAFRAAVRFKPEHIVDTLARNASVEQPAQHEDPILFEKELIGSNNWIVAGARSASGSPLLANDPHRLLAVPSLRYIVHLNGPGWNVVGGGEPTIPGVSIGHNEHGAWGLTIFALDAEDILVYKLNPENLSQYRYKNDWMEMSVIGDTIPVKNEPPRVVQHRFTQHGPVMYIDSVRRVAYAARCAWLDVGAAPYLASLRMDQATSWEEFREACSYSRLPGENMIWADLKGNIAWQAVGVAPIRKTHSGLVPVPGDGRFEWEGILPITNLPSVFNPPSGYFATANENNVPTGYLHRQAVGWNWADRFRVERVNDVLASRPQHTREDMMALQTDYHSLPAQILVSMLSDVSSSDPLAEAFRQRLTRWNFKIDKSSVEAAVYVAWERKLASKLRQRLVPTEGQRFIRALSLRNVILWLKPTSRVFATPADRAKFLTACLEESVTDLTAALGSDTTSWQYGQAKNHHVLIKHPLSAAVNGGMRSRIDHGPLPRSGYGATPGVTGNSANQTAGATFRMVADLSDWDKTVFTNAPGQSGDPRSPYYGNLFVDWANDRYFTVYFSRARIERSARERLKFVP